ncbi:cation:dicarboxylase symporter family transporter [Altererythrobacter arenosus]|uniref:Cation:dicarboxylase symporter family transporter n=1 Tax=Altererythrobacter arenosus TaxID=3032592 RepID=A0ABY8FM62_9SPHN|nr:cation:dicarboxylase symporter family transporter [Altererythrobacter sp. CAU 1644]WFL76107.1 cation:dicarboxylase symporter family transporter [Altererythrobacter sp. CAU 1644]
MTSQPAERFELVTIRLPVVWTFLGLVAGLALGALLGQTAFIDRILVVSEPIGTLWLRALQMTIIPLVASLLVLGIAQMVGAARAGAAARRFVTLVFIILIASGLTTAVLMPLLLEVFPIPTSAVGFLSEVPEGEQQLPGLGDFVTSLVASNVIAAAADTAMLPLTIFFAVLAIAITRLPEGQRASLLGLFHALGNAMLIIIGWVLWVAPIGVFALALGVAARSGGGAFAALAHYILVVSAMGLVVLFGAYLVAFFVGRKSPLAFAQAMIPAQAVALSTQSSLASLPAMLDSSNRLGLRQSTSEFVLPLAVAVFRATSPAMNMAVAVYVAHLAGVTLNPMLLAAGIAVAFIISIGSVSLPGSISFVISVGPIALAMGVPIEPLALLVAVEMLPDIMRTLGNVTMNVAVASAVDRVGPAD